MKKIMTAMMAALMMFSCSVHAENMEVQVISGPEEEMSTEPVDLSDIKVGQTAVIDGYAEVTILEYKTVDLLAAYKEGDHGSEYLSNPYYAKADVYESGAEADYALLKIDLSNMAVNPKNFLEKTEIKAVYNDKYEYAGWAYQYNYDNTARDNVAEHEGMPADPTDMVINPADVFPIAPMYDGHYVFGCTLPNKVIQGTESLRLVITLDGNEIIYNIRV